MHILDYKVAIFKFVFAHICSRMFSVILISIQEVKRLIFIFVTPSNWEIQ